MSASVSLSLSGVSGSPLSAPSSLLSNWNQNEDEPFTSKESNEKDCTIYVIDCGPEMFEGDTFTDVCTVLNQSFKRQIIQKPDDLAGIVLFNSKKTQNKMGKVHIYTLREPQHVSAQMIREMAELSEPEKVKEKVGLLQGKQCDFHELLWTCHTLFTGTDPGSKKYDSKRLFIFTKNDDPFRTNEKQTITKADDLAMYNVEINLFPLAKNFIVKKFYRHICNFDVEEYQPEDDFFASCQTLDALKNGVRAKEFKKRSLLSCPLTISDDIHLAIKLYVPLRKAEKGTPKYLDPKNNQDLTCETTWVCGDTGAVLDDSQYRTYWMYGPERVYFTKAEVAQLKSFGSPSLRLMGFKPRERLKDHHNLKPSYFMYPDEDSIQGSTVAFASFLQAMIDLDKIAICRFILRKTSAPKFVALLPQTEKRGVDGAQENASGFHVVFLPYADDLRKTQLSARKTAEQEQTLKAKACIDRLTLKTLPDFSNPVLQRHYDAIEALALDDAIPEEIHDETVDGLATMNRHGKRVIDDLKNSLPDCAVSRKRKNKAPGSRKKKVAKKKEGQDVSGAIDFKKLAEAGKLKTLKVKELKEYLEDNGLTKGGKKAVLIERIRKHLGL